MIIDSLQIRSNPATDRTVSALRKAVRLLCYELNEGLTYPDWRAIRNASGSFRLESDVYVDTFQVGTLGQVTLKHEVDTSNRRVVNEVDLDESLERPALRRQDMTYDNGFKDRLLSDEFSGVLDEATASGLLLRIGQVRGEIPVPRPRSGN